MSQDEAIRPPTHFKAKSGARNKIICLISLFSLIRSAKSFVVPGAVVHFSLGAVAGTAGAVAAYPFDYIKSQMQTEEGQVKYKNGADAFHQIVTNDPLQLYRGVGVQVMGIAPEKAIKLGMNNIITTYFFLNFGTFPLWAEIASGAIAGASQVVVTSPLEVLKTGLQTSDMPIDELMEKIGGFKGLFRGAEACILRDVLFTAILFPVYNHGQEIIPAFVAGSLAGVIASFIATPPDFIKTRMLSQDACTNERRLTQLFPNTEECGVDTNDADVVAWDELDYLEDRNPFVVGYKIAQKEGTGVMFSGVLERCAGAIPRFGVTLSMYDFLENCAQHHGWM